MKKDYHFWKPEKNIFKIFKDRIEKINEINTNSKSKKIIL